LKSSTLPVRVVNPLSVQFLIPLSSDDEPLFRDRRGGLPRCRNLRQLAREAIASGKD
jgi:hypothetical protein